MDESPEKKSRLQQILESLKGKSPEASDTPMTRARAKAKEMSEGIRREKADEFLNENVNQPLAEAGLPEVGAGLSAAASAGREMLPQDESEFAVGIPTRGISKAASRMAGEVEGLGAMNYGAMRAEDKANQAALRKLSEESADTLVYGGSRGPVRRKASGSLERLKGKKPD